MTTKNLPWAALHPDYKGPEHKVTTATFRRKLSGFRGDARLYAVSPPAPTGEDGVTTDYVVVSAVVSPYFGPETYIFPADVDGNVTRWLEMDGSYRGDLDHGKALRGAGWEVAPS